jgi:cell shape-determining protein MreC
MYRHGGLIVVLVLSVALLVLPRTTVHILLGPLRPQEAALVLPEYEQNPALIAYPALDWATGDTVSVPVFASGIGPYNHDLALAAGAEDGVAPHHAVVLPRTAPAQQPYFVGVIRSAADHRSTVQTFTDPEWKSAVRIGSSSIDALLVGGLTPTLTLIPKGAAVIVGDPVILADPAYPYGMAVGTVSAVRDASDGVLREATLALPYTYSGLRFVEVIAR